MCRRPCCSIRRRRNGWLELAVSSTRNATVRRGVFRWVTVTGHNRPFALRSTLSRMTLLPSHSDLAWPVSDGADPFIGLEALDDARVQAWVDVQNRRTEAAFGNTADARALAGRLEKAYTSKDRIVTCSRYGD